MQGFFWSELIDFAGRHLPPEAVRGAVRAAWPEAPAHPDPGQPCPPERLVALAGRLAAAEAALAAEGALPADAGAWLRRFGRALFARIAATHAAFFVGLESSREFLLGFERQVHEELRRLGRGLAPPRIGCEPLGPRRVAIAYRSERGLADLAHGMLEGCLAHFGDKGLVTRERGGDDGAERFVVELAPREDAP